MYCTHLQNKNILQNSRLENITFVKDELQAMGQVIICIQD